MLGQVIAAHESTVTLGTCKLLLSRVSSPVSRQFVGAGKLSITTFPTTAEGFFSCVCSHMRLQMGALEVSLGAPRLAADMTSNSGGVEVR